MNYGNLAEIKFQHHQLAIRLERAGKDAPSKVNVMALGKDPKATPIAQVKARIYARLGVLLARMNEGTVEPKWTDLSLETRGRVVIARMVCSRESPSKRIVNSISGRKESLDVRPSAQKFV